MNINIQDYQGYQNYQHTKVVGEMMMTLVTVGKFLGPIRGYQGYQGYQVQHKSEYKYS